MNEPRNYKEIPPDVHVLAVNQTSHWNAKSFGDAWERIDRIESIVLVDLAEQTHICSLTPSAWCAFLYHRVTYKQGLGDPSEDERELVDEILLSNPDDDDYYDYADMSRRAQAPVGPDGEFRHAKVDVAPDEIADALEKTNPQLALLDCLRERLCANYPL
jgi:hypothetical protein